jgi:hypothetical protein
MHPPQIPQTSSRLVNKLQFSGLLASLAVAASAFGQVHIAAGDPVARVEALVPTSPADCTEARSKQWSQAADALERWGAELAMNDSRQPLLPNRRLGAALDRIRHLADAQRRVDAALARVIALRTRFVELPESEDRREMLRRYLEISSEAIDLAGRMRYLMNDGIGRAAYEAGSRPDLVLDILLQHKSDVGGAVMGYLLFDPPPGSPSPQPTPATRKKLLDLMLACRKSAYLGTLAEFVRNPTSPPDLVIDAIEVIRHIGLPQDPDPSQGETPPPEITAKEAYAVLASMDRSRLSPAKTQERDVLMEWLAGRSRSGVLGDRFRTNGFDIQPGDWLLMRNPSPYNLFTDLAPGLFTHVGVVTAVEDDHGVRRFVIVEMPERQSRIPATNVDAYLKRTLHYLFMRHEDPRVAKQMSEAARKMIGNETQFDLSFDNRHVLALQGKDLADERIHTYCAGFLLLCAQTTSAPREDFFPIEERPAPGHCLENFAKLKLSLGEDFVSPTGCIFSPKLQLAGRREPFYEPTREVREAIYDHFAHFMRDRQLQPSPTIYQSLRQTLAAMSGDRPWLAQMIANANNVSQYTDLDAAARAAAVVETLDNIADESAEGFSAARAAIMAGPIEQLHRQGADAEEIAEVQRLRARHAGLYAQWTAGQITPRDLRLALVRHYAEEGRAKLEERFFPE